MLVFAARTFHHNPERPNKGREPSPYAHFPKIETFPGHIDLPCVSEYTNQHVRRFPIALWHGTNSMGMQSSLTLCYVKLVFKYMQDNNIKHTSNETRPSTDKFIQIQQMSILSCISPKFLSDCLGGYFSFMEKIMQPINNVCSRKPQNSTTISLLNVQTHVTTFKQTGY